MGLLGLLLGGNFSFTPNHFSNKLYTHQVKKGQDINFILMDREGTILIEKLSHVGRVLNILVCTKLISYKVLILLPKLEDEFEITVIFFSNGMTKKSRNWP